MDKELKKGELNFRTSSNLLALKWRDKGDVFILSSFHTSAFMCTEREIRRLRNLYANQNV